MKTVKVSEAAGPVLDWMVAKTLGYTPLYENFPAGMMVQPDGLLSHMCEIKFSSDWFQGGPIIDRIKGFEFKQWLNAKPDTCCEAHIHDYDGNWIQFGPTPLTAAMRCYVASKLGDEVEVPEGLTQ